MERRNIGLQRKDIGRQRVVENMVRMDERMKLGKIEHLGEANEWRFVPGKLNSRDLAKRSTLEAEETIPTWWLERPAFLKESEEH